MTAETPRPVVLVSRWIGVFLGPLSSVGSSSPRGAAVADFAERGSHAVATSPEPTHPTIAVAIPCHNEAGAVAAVVEAWRIALPEAEIVVFDNNSGDGTGAIARRIGVRVVEVRDQGKGHAVRAIFEDLADRDVVILVDGDGTYPAEAARALIEPILRGVADMTVGTRQPIEAPGAMTPVRGSRQLPDHHRLSHPDRSGNARPPVGLPRVQPPLPRGRPPLLRWLRDRGRDRRSGRRPRPSDRRDPRRVSAPDRRDRQQAPRLPRRPPDSRRHPPPVVPLPALASPAPPGRVGRGRWGSARSHQRHPGRTPPHPLGGPPPDDRRRPSGRRRHRGGGLESPPAVKSRMSAGSGSTLDVRWRLG